MASAAKTRASIRAAAIKALEDRHGRLTAEDLVQEARSPKHPMHRDFLWDDKKAGHQHRLDQARRYISEVRFVVTDVTRPIKGIYYVRDPDAHPNQGFIATQKLRSNKDVAKEALLYEVQRLEGQLERCKQVAAVLDLEDEIEAILDSVQVFALKLRPSPESGVGLS